MLQQLMNPYLWLGLILVTSTLFGVYKYQEYTISNLESKLEISNNRVDNLETNITGIKSVVTKFGNNQEETNSTIRKLQSSTSRLDVIIAKPTLVSRKIESSYAKFHLEKACYSGNKEACNELDKK